MNRINLIKNQLTGNKSPLVIVESVNESNKAIKIVRMNSPPLNPLGTQLVTKVHDTLIELDGDEETKVIILTGNNKAFAAGADIKKFSKQNYLEIIKDDCLNLFESFYYRMNKPLIAAVNGYAYGGGFELALCCDMILASDKASFGFPELKLGLFPGAGGTQRLARLMGNYKATEYILTTKDIPLNELKAFGVINDIVPHDQLITSAVKLAENICKFSLMTTIAAKKALRLSLETNLFTGLKAEKYIFQGIFNTEDKKIGVDAFLNKKTPVFKDK
jgi:enoyl-CoA hydratase